MKLGYRRKDHNNWAALRIYANQIALLVGAFSMILKSS